MPFVPDPSFICCCGMYACVHVSLLLVPTHLLPCSLTHCLLACSLADSGHLLSHWQTHPACTQTGCTVGSESLLCTQFASGAFHLIPCLQQTSAKSSDTKASVPCLTKTSCFGVIAWTALCRGAEPMFMKHLHAPTNPPTDHPCSPPSSPSPPPPSLIHLLELCVAEEPEPVCTKRLHAHTHPCSTPPPPTHHTSFNH